MRSLFIASLMMLCLPSIASAQQLIGTYNAVLGSQDHYSSTGRVLTDFGGILQQDRANVNRFGIFNSDDESDLIFTERAQRDRIPYIWRFGPNSSGLAEQVANGIPAYIHVEIFGYGNTPQSIVVHQGHR